MVGYFTSHTRQLIVPLIFPAMAAACATQQLESRLETNGSYFERPGFSVRLPRGNTRVQVRVWIILFMRGKAKVHLRIKPV
jgi:hypothetical protein